MLIVISDPKILIAEAVFVNQLFETGMELFHVRKPGVDLVDLTLLLKQINPRYHPQIALHQHHELANSFNINRLHFTEEKRELNKEETLMQLRRDNYILSTSVHQLSAYNKLSNCFNYTFFGPVFNSISKQGYNAIVDGDFIFPIKENCPEVIAIGGVSTKNINQAIVMKFNGIAVLGAIWQNPKNSLDEFIKLKKVWDKSFDC